MEWRDEGILLSTRPHGEASVIASVFTQEHGVHAGVIRGGQSRKVAPVLQAGAQLDLTWRARLEDHIGSFTAEPKRSRAAALMGSRLALSGASSAMALLQYSLPEREPHKDLYEKTLPLMDLLGHDDVWPLAYLQWEMAFLTELGFGLQLDECAATGATSNLVYVSPKSGRAVSAEGAGEWADRMLPMFGCMTGKGDANDQEIVDALGTTGYFLGSRLAEGQVGKPLPDARARFLDLLRKRAAA
ncbi:MAG: DNA repair protein RecO [Paracoccaceae bacterium]|jgi:DNA repair protein RecO (recombination protein O)|nr:DNA repair protein RecO [Paracoccaceae bacterium]